MSHPNPHHDRENERTDDHLRSPVKHHPGNLPAKKSKSKAIEKSKIGKKPRISKVDTFKPTKMGEYFRNISKELK